MEPDARLLPVIFPQPPGEGGNIFLWARKLVESLIKLQDKRAQVRAGRKTYAATMVLDPQQSEIYSILTTHAIGNATIELTSPKTTGGFTLLIKNDGTSAKTITFGSGFVASGTLVGTIDKTAAIQFVSDGTGYYELARKTGL